MYFSDIYRVSPKADKKGWGVGGAPWYPPLGETLHLCTIYRSVPCMAGYTIMASVYTHASLYIHCTKVNYSVTSFCSSVQTATYIGGLICHAL